MLRPRDAAVRFLMMLAATAVLMGGSARADSNPFGPDLDFEDGVELVAMTRAGLAEILKLQGMERREAIGAFLTENPVTAMDALKRCRNPELADLLIDLLGHDDWRIRHRALLALEAFEGPRVFRYAWYALTDKEPRVRARAAITCIRTFDKKEAKELEGGKPERRIGWWLRDEPVPQVAAALRAVVACLKGRLEVRTLQPEFVQEGDDGVRVVPLVRSLDEAKALSPLVKAPPRSETSGRDARTIDETRPWTTPLIAFGRSEADGASPSGFGDPGQGEEMLHTGVDVGAALDGDGLFAVADGIVRAIHTGRGRGTEIVVQHHLGGGRLIDAVYRHAAPTVFVRAGDRVESGDLLGTIGMAFSAGNGGVHAHLDFGLRRSGPEVEPSLAARPTSHGLVDWYDPSTYLSEWATVTQPLTGLPEIWNSYLTKAHDLLLAGRLSAAVAEARKVEANEKINEGGRYVAELFAKHVEGDVASAAARARTIRDLGYPDAALSFLRRMGRIATGLEGASEIRQLAAEWARDGEFEKAVTAERELLALEETLVPQVGQDGAREAAVKALKELAERHAGTSVARRIERRIEAAEAE